MFLAKYVLCLFLLDTMISFVTSQIDKFVKHVHSRVNSNGLHENSRSAGSHVALRGQNTGAESAGELFTRSKDSASLLVCSENKIFWFWVLDFCELRRKWRTFRPPWSTSPGPGPKPLDRSISLKFLLETRLKSVSFDTLNDLLWVQKL